ncbi:hypothetical protein Tco_1370089 [Tanacetum coccineum]
MIGESSSSQDFESKPSPSTSGNQEELDDFDFWMDSYAIDDDELPTEKVLQELVDEMSKIVDEAKLCKVVNEMLRQRCTSGNEHQYHINQMQNFLKNDIVKDLLYLNKGSSGPEKIVMSLHKFLAVMFPDDDVEERTSRWFITEIIARIKNGSIVSITDSDYKNLNKNDIKDMYLLIVNDKLGVKSYQQKVNLTAPTINFPGIMKYKVFSIVSELVYGIMYKNSKKEKRVMRLQEIHKFCDATLKRVLEGLNSYNNDVKYGYVTLSLSKEDAEYLQLFEEEIEEWLKHRDQIRPKSRPKRFYNGGDLPGMVRVGYMTYFQYWYDGLIDGNLKEQALKQKVMNKRSWGDATHRVMNFYAWLNRCFGNFHELYYELLVKLEEYWWKMNDHECSLFTNWRNHIRGTYANINIDANYNPYLDVSRIFNNHTGRNDEEAIHEERKPNDNHGIRNFDNDLVWNNAPCHANEEEDQYGEDRCELLGNPRQEPPVCKIRRFKVIKYSFGPTEKYIAIKECEHDDWTRTKEDACHAYQ